MKWCLARIFATVAVAAGLAATAAGAQTQKPVPEKFTGWKNGTETAISIYRVGTFRVNESCYKNQKNCKALGAVLLQPTRKLSPAAPGLAVHPADRHCQAIGGETFILRDSSLNQTNYCEFSDGSLIDSWDLYEAFKNKIGGAKK